MEKKCFLKWKKKLLQSLKTKFALKFSKIESCMMEIFSKIERDKSRTHVRDLGCLRVRKLEQPLRESVGEMFFQVLFRTK